MTQATASQMASSTPIRIGSGAGSFHGVSSAHQQQHHHHHHHGSGNAANVTSNPGGDSPSIQSQQHQQSSSVPSSGGMGRLQLQSQGSLTIGSSQQSLGVTPGGAAGGSQNATPPNSAGLRQSSAFDFKFVRRTSSKVLLPKLPSSDSLSNSPGPSSPGFANWTSSENRENRDSRDNRHEAITQIEKTPTSDTSKLNRKESYKAQRKNYRREKKRVASELLNSLQDPAVIVLADWLKVRGTLKSWTKLWCVLKPGLLLIYKSPKTKSSHWVGTVLLTSCQVIERPSKKDGFCFKLFHPLEQSIWAPRGPDKETIGAVVQPLPTAYLIFRAPSQAAGKCWMDALELSLRCSALLLRSSTPGGGVHSAAITDNAQTSHETQWSEADYEKHFNEAELLFGDTPPRHSPSLGASKRQFLTVPDVDGSRSYASSETSMPSRSQTPIFQQLYTTMTNWERYVTSTPEFQKIKNFRKMRKEKREQRGREEHGAGMFAASEMSDVSSSVMDFSPQHRHRQFTLKTVPVKLRRANQLIKSKSLGDPLNGSSSSSAEDSQCKHGSVAALAVTASTRSTRPLSAPSIVIKQLNTGSENDLDADSQNEAAATFISGGDTETDSEVAETVDQQTEPDPPETPYVEVSEEEFATQTGEQVEELAEENKSLIWCLVKQVRPGMDLSKVVLPTFILEPRSFLDKLSDSYYHADILARAVTEDDPFTRMKTVLQWYLSGFYKKPKGLKKPYNPILGECFRCYWQHPNGSRTFYIAEQVSHHPPVSAFYVTNRQDGFCISCSILAKSKFYGNSTSAVLEGVANLTLLPRGETYTLTTPYAHCKGILMGTLSMELGGKVTIECENTGYKTELEFKLKPFLGGSDSTNCIGGKIKLGKETLATVCGHWDSEMRIKDAKTSEESVLFSVTGDIKQRRLKRFLVPLESQLPNESERLWQLVSAAIRNDDQEGATREKTVLEEAQRNAVKERRLNFTEWVPLHFNLEILTGQWLYKYADLRPWDPRNDVRQYESNFQVLTKTRHKAPMVRTSSIVSAERIRTKRSTARISGRLDGATQSDTSQSNDDGYIPNGSGKSLSKLINAIDQVNKALDDHTQQLTEIQSRLERLQYYSPMSSIHSIGSSRAVSSMRPSVVDAVFLRSLVYGCMAIIFTMFVRWVFK